MTKKCLGCGIFLQDKSPYTLGYTPNVDNDYCERCFKITHYNAKIDASLSMNNDELIEKINQKKAFVIYLCDFFNLFDENIDFYKRIKGPKCFLITKSDLIPKNIIKKKVLEKFKAYYKIEGEVLFCSVKVKENLSTVLNILQKNKKVLFAGTTNSGKSSLINHLLGAKITVSKNANTTLDFIPLKFDFCTIFDAPGFLLPAFIDSGTPKSIVKPVVYQLKSKYCLCFMDITLASNVDNNLTFYLSNTISIEKRKIKSSLSYDLAVDGNSDVFIKGLGFIHVVKASILHLSIDASLVFVRPSLIGGYHE